jgi:hypothetical protein
MFLPPTLVRAANGWVHDQSADKNPVFKRSSPGLVTVNGAILRYSTTTGDKRPE